MTKQKIVDYQNQLNLLKSEEKRLEQRLAALKEEKAALNQALSEIKNEILDIPKPEENPSVDAQFSASDRLAIFRDLFKGRTDVFPKRWENAKSGRSGYSPACANEWRRGVCQKPKVKCSDCPHQAFIPVDDKVLFHHLAGSSDYQNRRVDATIGIYPLLPDSTCWFLAVDFDKASWIQDVSAFLETCRVKNVPAVVEKSRSGNGAHVWIFFSFPVPAVAARTMGAFLITRTMERCPDIGFESYDRFFPNQDTMPSGGFGNLIALPLQRIPRDKGNSLFVDGHFQPYPDQWAFLSTIRKMTPEEVAILAGEGSTSGQVIGLRIPVDEKTKDPWASPPSRNRKLTPIKNVPKELQIVQGNQVYIPRKDLPPPLINRLIRLAAFQNPEFYKAQAMRLSTFDKPRVISCGELFSDHIGLPRGCLEESLSLFQSLGIEVNVQEKRTTGKPVKTKFLGKLHSEQRTASAVLSKHDIGVLAATTAFGKTVVAIHIIAKRRRNTLILVHRKQLLDQWMARLETFLDNSKIKIGQIGGGKRKPSGVIDVALIQSLVRKGTVDDIVANYGQIIVDECHHLSAVSFEAVIKECKAKYVLGLTATAVRKDGHHPIIFMQCGPIRYKVDPKKQAQERPFNHSVIQRYTNFRLEVCSNEQASLPFHEIYRLLSVDQSRNELLINDVMMAMNSGRFPLILTERKEHLEYLQRRLSSLLANVIVLHGGTKPKERKAAIERLEAMPETEKRLLIATGRYLGEGFDDSRLDTLFLAMPISWRGTLAQYAGRLHRLHHRKKEVIVFDYVDQHVPVLVRMSEKRMLGYKSLGYETRDFLSPSERQ